MAEINGEQKKINYSIIIPHFNIPQLLGRCLRSIPEREDVQIIVVDDNSPGHENYMSIVPELKRANVEFYVTKDGLGAGHARNVGLSHAIGKWVLFSDSDDFFTENISELMDEYLNDEHDILFFNVKSCECYNTEIEYKIDKLKKYKETRNDIYLRVCYTEPWGKFIKHELIRNKNIKFQETKAHNDLLFAVKSGMEARNVLAVDTPLYWYVIREGSLGHQKGKEQIEKIFDRFKAWHTTQIYLESRGIRTKMYLPILPTIEAVKKDYKLYFSLFSYAKRNNYRYMRLLVDTVRYAYFRLIRNLDNISYNGMLIV